MNNYEYMAIAKKLMEKDNQKNIITGLVVVVFATGGLLIIQHQWMKAQKRHIAGLLNNISQIQEQNRRHGRTISRLEMENRLQKQVITELEVTNQALNRQLSENQKQMPQA